MDTHEIYEGAIRLLATHYEYGYCLEHEINYAVEAAAAVWFAAHAASKTHAATTREVTAA